MEAVDISDHYEASTAEETPSLLSVIIDTNPNAWALLNDGALPLSLATAVANLLVFVNAHLALSAANQVAVIAAHVNRAVWLYPSAAAAAAAAAEASSTPTKKPAAHESSDFSTQDTPADGTDAAHTHHATTTSAASKFPQFAQIETTVLASLHKLMAETTFRDFDTITTQLSGALTLALCHINKAALALSVSDTSHSKASGATTTTTTTMTSSTPPLMKGRILVLSVSDSESAQYIPTMNAVFAAAHSRVAIDTLALSGDATFLQQACFNTGGIFLRAGNPQGLLNYLMFGMIADTEARDSLVTPTHDTVDFRAACFCHGNVVDTGFVCSICLSIFCDLPENVECLTCGTKLALGTYGAKPAVVPRKKKKKKKVVNGSGREDTMSATGTPRP